MKDRPCSVAQRPQNTYNNNNNNDSDNDNDNEQTMNLATAPYLQQSATWPSEGEHILAHYDDSTVVVYQAYRPAIGLHALEHGRFGGPDFSFTRMSWIKPNFLWMMYRCGWATKAGQEVILGLRIRRTFFESLLDAAVPSTFNPQLYAGLPEWQQAVATSEVRQQWDPDHAPSGAKLPLRAIQLGLRGKLLRRFATEELLEVIDMTSFVIEQRAHAQDENPMLMTPVERVYVRLDRKNCAPENSV